MLYADRSLTPLGFQRVLVSSDPVSLPLVPNSATYAYIQAISNDLIWRDDGGTLPPGHLLRVNMDLWYVGDLHKIRFIRESSDAYLHVSYYRA